MFLSIIVPNYNLPQELLKRCIDSVLALEIPAEEYEIITVDDGSETPPHWIKASYPFSNIQLIESEHNGQGGARNKGISAAVGKYLLFLDGDDTLYNSSAMQQCLEKAKQERPDILRFKYRTTTDTTTANNNKQQKVHFGNTISGAAYMAKENLPGSSCCYFIRKEFVENKGIRFTPHIYYEDDEFTTMAHFHAQTLIVSDAILYNYYLREESTTHSRTIEEIIKREKNHIEVIKRLCTFRNATLGQSNNIQKRAIQRKLTMLVVDFIIKLIRSGKRVKEVYTICQKELAETALYPLIPHRYGIKYRIFQKLANHPTGLRILKMIIPKDHR
ncbi:MAG: glycosyltransferase family 2 protein [Bacteroidaceae bacterium]|nr:glycosyltransferase family 2 protein [Bacteroidaceae bacterium]